MVNINGKIEHDEKVLTANNRAFLFGDGVFETVKVLNGKILFLEDHYFRLMSAMRIVRMEIPMDFTMDYFEGQILSLLEAKGFTKLARARITVYRNGSGFYFPVERTVSFLIQSERLTDSEYTIGKALYEVDLYKDYHVSAELLSSIKSTNRILNVTAGIYAVENDLDNCLLLNHGKNVVEAIHGNIFMLTENKLVTPAISEGCLNGVMRKQVLQIAREMEGITVSEESISPFDLQKADELFITNVIMGIQPVSRYRKKEYNNIFAVKLLEALNNFITRLVQ